MKNLILIAIIFSLIQCTYNDIVSRNLENRSFKGGNCIQQKDRTDKESWEHDKKIMMQIIHIGKANYGIVYIDMSRLGFYCVSKEEYTKDFEYLETFYEKITCPHLVEL